MPERLSREDLRHPAPCACPSCGDALRKISDEVTETLDYVPGGFKAVVTFAKNCRAGFATLWSQRRRQTMCSPAGEPGQGAHIVVSKPDDHLPLYRQAEIFARDGVSLETSTLSGWVGGTAAALQPLVDALAGDVIVSDALHVGAP